VTDPTDETPMADETRTTSADPAASAPPHAAAASKRRGRPRGAASGTADSLRLEGQTTKSYALGDGSQRTIRYLRLVVNQRQIPDDATVAIESDRITIEWSE
jgi:hypothetical protein